MRTKLAGAVVGFAIAFTPFVSSAASLTTDQQNAVINLLQSFNVDTQTIATVKAVLSGQTPPQPTSVQGQIQGQVQSGDDSHGGRGSGANGMMPPGQKAKDMCAALNRTLGLGAKGDDVRKLQEFLKDNGNFDGKVSGTFGSMTQHAVQAFQMQNGLASSSTGILGPATKSFLDHACGKGEGQDKPPAIMRGFSGLISANDGASTVTLQNKEGKSVTVTLTTSTVVDVFTASGAAPTKGSIADLIVGKMASAEGSRTGDSAMAAVRIKVGPAPSATPR